MNILNIVASDKYFEIYTISTYLILYQVINILELIRYEYF